MARVEASSLSAINLLAAHPPRYPVNPTEEPREPLTLYIARVPGTRDVILSTLKPQRKNVTAEDVANALYYVHLDLPTDRLLAPPPPPAGGPSSGAPPAGPAIARKPVPAAARPDNPAPPPAPRSASPSLAPPPAPTAEPTPDPWVPPGFRLDAEHSFEAVRATEPPPPAAVPAATAAAAAPAADPARDRSASTSTPSIHAPIARKPVGPRPLVTGGAEAAQPPQLAQPPPSRQSSPPPPALPPRPTPPPLPPRPSTPSAFVPFQLTLIRRDPSTNNQWNIGKISSVQVADPAPTSPTMLAAGDADVRPSEPAPPQEQPTIRILIETSGYAKFRDDDEIGRQGAFGRQVVMAYTKSWTAGIRKAFRRHDRSSSDGAPGSDPAEGGGSGSGWTPAAADELPAANRPPFLRPRNNSLGPAGSGTVSLAVEMGLGGGGGGGGGSEGHRSSKDATRAESPPPLITRPGPGLKPKGYTFASPWQGRCEFRTGNGGRSLKCRHILHPTGDSADGADGSGVTIGGYNPLVIAQNLRDGQALAAVAAAAAATVTGGGSGGGGGGGGGSGIGAGGGGRSRAGSLTAALTGAATVSELRFNLPSGELFRPAKGEEGAGSYGRFHDQLLHPVHGGHGPFHHRNHHRRGGSTTTEDEDDEDEDEDAELDLSLGRERAGGGARGKRAKLGKLIVYDDGFKMLDLLVAANMGVWWVSWEKRF